MALNLSKKYSMNGTIFDFLNDQTTVNTLNQNQDIELDYEWDWTNDPIITPTIIHEWKNLGSLLGSRVLKGATSIISLGGGGSSQTYSYMDENSKELYIVNPGIWDLRNAKIPNFPIKTILVRGIGENLPFLNCSVDAIEIPSTLDHVVDPVKVLSECYRVLKSGGKIGITLGNSHSWYRILFTKLRVGIQDNHKHAHNFHFSIDETERLLIEAGFKKVDTVGTAYLKLPKKIERRIKFEFALTIHSFFSNVLLKIVFKDKKGGMFLTYGAKD